MKKYAVKMSASAILGGALLLSGLSPCYAALPASPEEFNAFFKTIEEERPKSLKKSDETARLTRDWEQRQTERLPRLWDILDRLIVGLLNSQKTTRDIQEVLSQLSGYKQPWIASKTTIGGAVFSDGTDREYPNYWIVPVDPDATAHILGVYDDGIYPYMPLTSRLSVFTRKNAEWVKTDAFDGTMALSLHMVPSRHRGNVLMTVENFVGADHISGSLKFWKLDAGGKLRLLAQNDELLDYAVYRKEDRLTVTYTEFPKNLLEPVMGKRVHFTIDVYFDKRGLTRKVTCLNPWLKVLNDYFGCLKRGDLQGAKSCLRDPSLLFRLKRGSWIDREEGDIDLGTAVVEMTNGLRVAFQRDRSNKWVISDVLQQ